MRRSLIVANCLTRSAALAGLSSGPAGMRRCVETRSETEETSSLRIHQSTKHRHLRDDGVAHWRDAETPSGASPARSAQAGRASIMLVAVVVGTTRIAPKPATVTMSRNSASVRSRPPGAFTSISRSIR